MSSKKPDVPTYAESPMTTDLEKLLFQKSKSLADMPYGEWYQRFNVPESDLAKSAVSRMENLFSTQDYTPTSYEDFLSKITPDSTLSSDALSKYKGLIDTQDYSLTDTNKIEQDYLDTVLRKYSEARDKGLKPIQESLIAENLMGSGPGYEKLQEYGKESAEGVGDITKTWAYEGIQRKQQQQQYMDALKRGDYTTMYNLALQDEQKQYTQKTQAMNLAEAEKQYYDALSRGDIETAFNVSQLIRQNQLYPIEQATNAEFNALSPAQNLYSTLTQKDLAKYNAAMQAYQAQLQSKGSMSGLGTALGIGLMAATGGTIGGSALAGMMMGGAAGGGLGSMFSN